MIFITIKRRGKVKMKILYIIKVNSGATWAYTEAEYLKRNYNIDILVILPQDDVGSALKYKALGMKVIAADLSLPITKPWKFFERKKRFLQIIEEEKPDIIHFHFVTNVLFARLAIRNIPIPRLFQVPGPLHLENGFFRKLEIGLKNEYDYWAGSCRKTCEIYKENGIERSKLFLCYYGGYIKKELQKSETKTIRRQYNIDDNTDIVAMVSYFYKPKYYLFQTRGIKGHEDFIEAFKIVHEKRPNTIAMILGSPWVKSQKYMEKIKKMAYEECGDSIIFTGFRTDIFEIYHEFNVAVHPSHSENLGGAGESLALGVPTVSTNVGGFPDIVINGKTGYTFDVKSPEQMANAILKMLDNKGKAKEMATAGHALLYDLCAIEHTSDKMYEIYKTILNGDENRDISTQGIYYNSAL